MLRAILSFSLITVALLTSCADKQQQPVIIFKDVPHQTQNIDSIEGYLADQLECFILYFSEDGVCQYFIPSTYDTLVVPTSVQVTEVYHYDRGRYRYMPLPLSDTVEISYNQSNTVYRNIDVVESLIMLDTLCSENIISELEYNYNLSRLQQIAPELVPSDFVSIDTLFSRYYNRLHAVALALDSAYSTTIYKDYIDYRLRLAEMQPLRTIQRLDFTVKLEQRQLDFLNDTLSGYVSYWHYVVDCVLPLVSDGGAWEIPTIEAKGRYNKEQTFRFNDYRAVFDRLSDFEGEIPEKTLNIMRYGCLEQITHSGHYAEADAKQYFEKYKSFTTEHLETSYTPLAGSLDFPLRFFSFLIRLTLCSFLFYIPYLLHLRTTSRYTARRLYLIAALVLSIVVSLLPVGSFTIPVSEHIVASVSKHSMAFSILLAIYLCIIVVVIAGFLWKLARIIRLYRDSWRINEGRYTLCVTQKLYTQPFSFLRYVFITWHRLFYSNDAVVDTIIDREAYRIRTWHTFDVLLLTALRMAAWANPMVYVYTRELRKVNVMAAERYMHAIVSEYPTSSGVLSLSGSNMYYRFALAFGIFLLAIYITTFQALLITTTMPINGFL